MTTSMITSNSAMAMAYPSAVVCELEYMSGQPTLCHSLQPDTCTPFAPGIVSLGLAATAGFAVTVTVTAGAAAAAGAVTVTVGAGAAEPWPLAPLAPMAAPIPISATADSPYSPILNGFTIALPAFRWGIHCLTEHSPWVALARP